MKPPKQYFDFYLHGQNEFRRGVRFSHQKHKILDEISKSQHDQGCIIKKVKLNEQNTDFVLADFTAVTKSKLTYDKASTKFYIADLVSQLFYKVYIF